MPEPLKNLYSAELIKALCQELNGLYQKFDAKFFTDDIFDAQWGEKELKDRMAHISRSLYKQLPGAYPEAVEILKKASLNFNGFEYMFFPGFVELYGQDEFEVSIDALEHFTERASSEFAVRPFIKKYGATMMAQMNAWADSENHHVRRLASEGCRPRLPWAMALPEFKNDPAPVLRILNKLKDDESEFVRRSVANNLNDISKDNPDVVLELARRWLGDTPERDRLVKHACRTLLKQGQPEILTLFGFSNPGHIQVCDFVVQESVKMGGDLPFSFTLQSTRPLGKLRIEYAIDFMKKNGKPARKIFKISESENAGKEKLLRKSYSFREISTRKYYVGQHGIAVIVNGVEMANGFFELSKNSDKDSAKH